MGVKSIFTELGSHQAILFDTNSIIYYLDDITPYSEIIEEILSKVQSGHLLTYLSVITAAELLVKPLREKDQTMLNQIMSLTQHFPNLTLAEITQEVSFQAALIRATTGLKLPDALIIATAEINDCVIIGNDSKWSTKILPVPYFYLTDYI
jgi:predicted nucleic acid-binding protein